MIHTPDRWLSKAGLASRAEVRKWIEESRLRLDGRLVRPDQAVRSPESTSRLMVLPPFFLDGVAMVPPPPLLLLANKPRGVLVTRSDPQGRNVIGDLLLGTPWDRAEFGSVRPLGRLDRASAGLILLSNFPELFSTFLDPSSKTQRNYRVQIAPSLRAADRPLFLSGEAGKNLGYDRISLREERVSKKTGWINVGLVEGKNREVRNLMESYGYQVRHLIRTAFGPFELSGLAPGMVSDITERAEEAGVQWIEWARKSN